MLHLCNDDTAVMGIALQKEIFYVPLMFLVRAVFDCSDSFIFTYFGHYMPENLQYLGAITSMLAKMTHSNLHTHNDALNSLGNLFRYKIDCPAWFSNEKVARLVLGDVLAHLSTGFEKFQFFAFMFHKLFLFSQGKLRAENPDHAANQEILTSGAMCGIVLKERVTRWLGSCLEILASKLPGKIQSQVDSNLIQSAALSTSEISKIAEYFFTTGNFSTLNTYGLKQLNGFCMNADYINFTMFLSNFRAIHRGVAFTKNTNLEVRQMSPVAFGYICPAHTPDGAPCGILNHMADKCEISSVSGDHELILAFLKQNSVVDFDPKDALKFTQMYSIFLDGKLAGKIDASEAQNLMAKLRKAKIFQMHGLVQTTELLFVSFDNKADFYPGVYIFSELSRLTRPVMNLKYKKCEYIGPLQQMSLDVGIYKEEVEFLGTDMQELYPSAFLSIVASLTPFCESNPGPRNVYQTQMSKQTMGNTVQCLKNLTEAKQYRLVTPQSPIVRSDNYNRFEMDEHSQGTNIIMAVISYTVILCL